MPVMAGAQVSFIIIAYNAAQTIRACVESIVAQPVAKEIILVDNNSTDGTAACVADLPLTVVFEARRCRGTARNRGLEAAQGAWIAFVDADVELPPEWAPDALALLEKHPACVAVGGPGLTPAPSWVSRALDTLQFGVRLDEPEHMVRSLPTMDVMYRGAELRSMRFADWWTAEDAELNFRLSRLGCRFLWSPKLAVRHWHVSTLRQLIDRGFRYGMWFAALYQRHPDQLTLDVILRIAFLPGLLALAVGVVFWPWLVLMLALWLLAPVVVYAWIAAGSVRLRRARAWVQFVVVHSLKQYAHMLGIWAGLITGTGRA
jgi:glycosyltransferase involved in cell wall biosynthesis